MNSKKEDHVSLDVAIYLRKSRADIEEEREAAARNETYDTLGKHRKQLMTLARQGGYNVIDIFEEVISGEFLSEREEAKEMIRKVRLSNYDAVLCIDIDRLIRGNKSDEHQIETAFRESGTLIITPDSAYDLNQESGELNAELRIMLSRIEHKTIKKRLHAGRLRSTSEGKEMSTKPPFGYHKDKNLKLVIYEPEAKIVRKIYDWCLQGYGRVKIAEMLTDLGVPSPAGKDEWGHASVRRILKSEKYKGAMFFGKHQSVKSEGRGYRKRSKRDESKFVYLENTHEPIVSRDIWEQAQESMVKRRTSENTKRELVNPFASIIKCSRCGKTLLANNPGTRPNVYLYCGTKGCPTKMTTVANVEVAVMEYLEEALKRIENIPLDTTQDEHTRNEIIHHIQEIEQMIEEDAKRRDTLHDLLENGTYDKKTFLERMRTLQDRQNEYKSKLHRYRRRLEMIEDKTQARKDIKPLLEHVLATYNKLMTPAEKNDLFRSVIKVIRYRRDRDWTDQEHFRLEIELIN